ncbi:MAG: phosphotransferase [Caldilineaceae bacterium]
MRARPLTGGVSARVTALDVLLPDGQRREFVLREHGPADVAANAHVAADEFRLLSHLHAAGLPVPKPVAHETRRRGAAASAIVLERLAAHPRLRPADSAVAPRRWPRSWRAFTPSPTSPPFCPTRPPAARRLAQTPTHVDAALAKARSAALTSVWPLCAATGAGAAHGDFWPGNVLWQTAVSPASSTGRTRRLGSPGRRGQCAPGASLGVGTRGHGGVHGRLPGGRAGRRRAPRPIGDPGAALRPAGKLSSWIDAATARTMRDQHRWSVTQALANLNKPSPHAQGATLAVARWAGGKPCAPACRLRYWACTNGR